MFFRKKHKDEDLTTQEYASVWGCKGEKDCRGPRGRQGPAGPTGPTAPSIYAQQGKCRNHAAFSTLKTIKQPL